MPTLLSRIVWFRKVVPRLGEARSIRLLVPALACAAFHVLITSLYLVPFAGDPGVLVCAPAHLMGQGPLAEIHRTLSPHGFDGTYYYVIAQNPLHPVESFIDSPCYRRVRVFYPLAAWTLSAGGDPVRLLWVMPLLNLLATCGLAWLGVKLADHYGRNLWWGALLPIAANAVLPSLRNLTDPWSALAVMGLLSAWLLRWSPTSLGIWGIIAVLTREQNLAIVGIVGLCALMERDRRRLAAMVMVTVAAALWIGTLWASYGHPPRAADTVDPPLAGLWYGWTHLSVTGHGAPRHPAPHFVRMALLTAQVICCLRIAFDRPRAIGLFALAAAGLAIVSGQALFTDPSNYFRVLNWAPMAVWIWTVQSGRRWPLVLLLPAVVWPILEVRFVWLMTA